MYMLPIAGQTAGPNGLKFVVVGVCQLFKKKNFPRATLGPSASCYLKTTKARVTFAEKPLMNMDIYFILDQTKLLRVPL